MTTTFETADGGPLLDQQQQDGSSYVGSSPPQSNKPRSPVKAVRKKAAQGARRRSTAFQVRSLLQDLDMEVFLEDMDVPHPDEDIFPHAELEATPEEIDQIKTVDLLMEPLGRYFLNETVVRYRGNKAAGSLLLVGKDLRRPSGVTAAYNIDYEEENAMREAGALLRFLDEVYILVRSKPSGRLTIAEALELCSLCDIDIGLTVGDFEERQMSEEVRVAPSDASISEARVVAMVEQAIPDDSSQKTRASVNIKAPIFAQRLVPVLLKKKYAKGSNQGKKRSEVHARKSLLGNTGSFAGRKKTSLLQDQGPVASPRKSILQPGRSFRTKQGLINHESSRRLDIPMDIQKSLADEPLDSSFESSTNDLPGGGSVASFFVVHDENGHIKMKLEQPAKPGIIELIVDRVAERLDVLIEQFKSIPEFVAAYLSLRKMSQQTLTEERLARFRVLGHGSFGEVHGVSIRTIGFLYAQKSFLKERLRNKTHRTVFLAELHCLRALTTKPSPFCLKMIAAYETSKMYHIVVPLGSGGDLKHYLDSLVEKRKPRRLSLDQARFYACEIGLALQHLHTLGFLYRDLKPANVLLNSKGHCLLIDFGLSTYVGDRGGRTSGRCGTSGYYSPEVLEGKTYSVDIDWWAFGCTVFEFLAGMTPFDPYLTGLASKDDALKLRKREIKFPPTFPDEAKELIAGLLNHSVNERSGCMGNGVEELFDTPFWDNWDLTVDDFRVRADALPIAPYIPEAKTVHAPPQEEAGVNLEKFANALPETGQHDVKFVPFVNKEEIQRDIVRLLLHSSEVAAKLGSMTSMGSSVPADIQEDDESNERLSIATRKDRGSRYSRSSAPGTRTTKGSLHSRPNGSQVATTSPTNSAVRSDRRKGPGSLIISPTNAATRAGALPSSPTASSAGEDPSREDVAIPTSPRRGDRVNGHSKPCLIM